MMGPLEISFFFLLLVCLSACRQLKALKALICQRNSDRSINNLLPAVSGEEPAYNYFSAATWLSPRWPMPLLLWQMCSHVTYYRSCG